jgi:hypothetical protein
MILVNDIDDMEAAKDAAVDNYLSGRASDRHEKRTSIRVEDAIGMRDALESLIATAVETFEEETGLEVTGIYVPAFRDGRKLKITTVLPAKKAEIAYPF